MTDFTSGMLRYRDRAVTGNVGQIGAYECFRRFSQIFTREIFVCIHMKLIMPIRVKFQLAARKEGKIDA